MKTKSRQIELFAAHGEIHALGLLGWEDALWTKLLKIELLSGEVITLNLATIRQLHCVAKQLTPDQARSFACATGADKSPSAADTAGKTC